VELKQWCSQSGLAQLEIGRSPGHFTLKSPRGNLDFASKSQSARWLGMHFLLGYAPQMSNGKCYIHRLDFQNSVLPLVNSCDCTAKPIKVLVIDPGHGGEPGSHTIVGGRTEKQLTLDWALRTRALLAGHGLRVYLTRTNDVEVPLTNRVAFAEKVHADLFISLHFNSLANSDQLGIETYCTTPAGMPSNLVRGAEDLQAQVNNAYDADNLCWALQIHHDIITATHATDRGVRRARFLAVLRNQKRPAILIEGGYLSSRKEATQIITEAYRQKLAEGLAHALLKQKQ
jgi:N-acetylmuramoyl-L-alanine amidase